MVKKFSDLFVFDLDGTLVHSLEEGGRGIPAPLRGTLFGLSEIAHIMIATGRRYRSALPDINGLPPMEFLVLHNGLLIKNRAGESIYRSQLKPDLAGSIVESLRSHGLVPFLVLDGEKDYVISERDCENSEEVQLIIEKSPHHTHVVRDEEFTNYNQIPILEVAALADYSVLKGVQRQLTTLPQGYRAVVVKNIGVREFGAMEIFHEMTSKWSGVQFAKQHLCVERIITIGDDENDLEMIKYSDFGVSMIHAEENIRKVSQLSVDGPLGLKAFLDSYLATGELS